MNKGRIPPVSLYKYFFHITPLVVRDGVRIETGRNTQIQAALDDSLLPPVDKGIYIPENSHLKSNSILFLILLNTASIKNSALYYEISYVPAEGNKEE